MSETNEAQTTEILEIIEKAREFERTKSIRTATDVCNMLNKYADKYLTRYED